MRFSEIRQARKNPPGKRFSCQIRGYRLGQRPTEWARGASGNGRHTEGAGNQRNEKTGAPALFLPKHFKGHRAPGFRKMGKSAPQLSSRQSISKGIGRRDSGKWESRRPSSHLVKAFQRAGGAGIQESGKTGAPALFLPKHFKGHRAPGFIEMRKPAPQDPGKRSSWRCFSIAIFRCKKSDPFSKSKGITLVQYMKCFINSAHGYSL